ncbi:MAG: TRAP transporter small permease subunit [Gammaproteobacteria bacterium]|nr:TRAP transporter small permease subunit [Gammaproteobacteria bacterium]
MNALKKLASFLNQSNEVIGRVLSWLVLALTLMVVYDVSMRYLFREGSVAIQEMEWHIFSLIFLLGAAYTYKNNEHVRVEILYQKFSERTQLWVDTLGDVLFLIPISIIVFKASLPFVQTAFEIMERSPDAGGLPYRYLIKAVIPAGFALLALQGVANAIDNLLKLYPPKGRH